MTRVVKGMSGLLQCTVYQVIQTKALDMQFILRAPWISITIFLVLLYQIEMESLSNRNKLKGPKIITGTICCISGFPPGASGSLHQKENREASPFCYF